MITEESIVIAQPALRGTEKFPAINLNHIHNLTDSTGIIQHAIYHMPNRKEGYCIDDNSRALLLMVWAKRYDNNQLARQLLPVYLGFIHFMQTPTGEFKNFMLYDKCCPEEKGSEDSFGRTIMALGYLVNDNASFSLVKIGEEILTNAFQHIGQLRSLRGMANSIIGLCQFVQFNQPDDIRKQMVVDLANKIVQMYIDNKKENWHWFEPVLAYDNAIMPLALLHAYELTGEKKYFKVATESMDFLESVVFHNNILRPVGNHGWMKRGGVAAQFDQQGIDAMAMVLYYQQAFKLSGERKHRSQLLQSYQWFLGANDLGLSLYDPETGGCADGLQADGINHNQGAESTLAFWLSHFAVLAALNE
jgi:hypothetical protein